MTAGTPASNPSIPAPPASAALRRTVVASGGIAVNLLALYIFLTYSRATELIATYIGNARIALVLCLALVLIMIVRPHFMKILGNRISLCFIVFTVCMMLSVPTSVWRGESLRLIVLQWPLPLASFFCMAVLIASLQDCYRIITAINLGTAFIVFLSFTSAGESFGRLGVATGNTLSNPNLLALQLIMGLPFCIFVIMRRGIFSFPGAVSFMLSAVTMYVILATGSRSGLLAIVFGGIVIFIQGSAALKVKLTMFAVLAGLAGVTILPGSMIARYKTIFGGTPQAVSSTESNELSAAINSSNARRRHLEQSIYLTFRNPLFGVGAGQFKVAAADLSTEKQEHADWLETHNTFTQVSSEEGIPAFLAFVLAIIYACIDLWKVYRSARRRPELAEVAPLSLMVLLSLIMTTVNANFASVAYQLYFPLLCGFAVAVTRASRNALLSLPSQQPVVQSPNAFAFPALPKIRQS